MSNINNQNNSNLDSVVLTCDTCNYTTIKLNHWKRHINSIKHIKRNSDNSLKKNTNLTCDKCNDSFYSKTTLWRHIKSNNCDKKTNFINEMLLHNQQFMKEQQQLTLDFVKEVLKSNQEQNEKLILDLVEKKSNITKASRITNNNSNNININFTNNIVIQLNEAFPDALTMNEFLNKLQYTLGDLTKMPNKPAFIEQVTSIICNKMAQLETKERPLHFIQDNGLNSFYIKENGEWEQKTKAEMNKQITKTAHCISKIRNNQWEDKLNSGTCTEKDQDNWTRYVKHVSADITDDDIDKSLQKIKKTVQLNTKELNNN